MKGVWYSTHDKDKLSQLVARYLPQAYTTIQTDNQVVHIAVLSDMHNQTLKDENNLPMAMRYTAKTRQWVNTTTRYTIPHTTAREVAFILDKKSQEGYKHIRHEQNPDITPKTIIATYARATEGTGFHRKVNTTVVFETNRSMDKCVFYAVEPVLEHHFLETDFLTMSGCEYWTNAPTDIELPSTVASQYLLRFKFASPTATKANDFYTWRRVSGGYELHYVFPYHFRYQPVSQKPYGSVEVLNPQLYMECAGDPVQHDDVDYGQELIKKYVLKSDTATLIQYSSEPSVWVGEVPVALENDKQHVALLTGGVTLVSIVLAISLILFKKPSYPRYG